MLIEEFAFSIYTKIRLFVYFMGFYSVQKTNNNYYKLIKKVFVLSIKSNNF
uniref:Uncharacterized protein n=1 Tax=Bartonella rochalimae ATCC BAA-1498 TaxID=685782 RepID=E6YMZ6_9HYPH|nr:hypothetical protein BARRO_80098 [Bartonella rochalimae ATCC BAA-1498]